MIAGATGTGKTVTLQVLAESFSALGVPVFMADAKGDLSGISQIGGGNPKVEGRAQELGMTLSYHGSPTIFWDLFGEQGHPIRTTVSEMGPLLLSRLLQLNDTQEGVLNVCFKLADDQHLLLLDLKDLRAILAFAAEHADEIQQSYGNVTSASVGAIQRQLLVLEQQGGDKFFGEPALDLADMMRTTTDGRGYVSVLAADKLMQSPQLYGTFLLWILAELFEEMPEVGDLEKPKLVFFFDEAHLLFDDAPKAVVDKVEQVVRLVRSKGVGIYFISQNPIDIPDVILGQLGNRFQHALRAFTPRDQKAIRSAAETFRANPKFSVETAIMELGVGVALTSVLDAKGAPTIVEITKVRPPEGRIGPATPDERRTVLNNSPISGKYDTLIDRESAFELLSARAKQVAEEQARQGAAEQAEKEQEKLAKEQARQQRTYGGYGQPARRSTREDPIQAMLKSTMRAAGSQIGRQLIRGVLGNLFKR